MTLTAGVLFSGIGGWDLGAERAGLKVLWGCEIDKFCTKVLTKRWPDAPIYPDVQTFDPKEVAPVDILIASPPCQDLSVAGKRAGLVGARSGLFFDFVRIAAALRPAWLLMEQVPGLVSSHKGEDFRQVVEAITELGYGLSWRCLDSRHLGVPQRRRRLYFVGRAGEPCPFEVLFEPEGGGGHPASRGAEGAEAPRAVGDGVAGALGGHHPRNDLDTSGAYIPEAAYAVTARDYKGVSQREGVTTLVAEDVAHTLRAQAQSAHAEDAETYAFYSHTGVDQKIQEDIAPPITEVYPPSVMPTLRDHPRPTSNGDGALIVTKAVALRDERGRDNEGGVLDEEAHTLHSMKGPSESQVIAFAWQQGDDSKFNKSGRGRSWVARAGDYTGALSNTRHDAVAIPAETTHTLKAEGADASEDGTGRGVPMVVDPKVFSIMPMNSNTDYKAREVPVTQPLLGGPGRNQGGDLVLAAPLTHGSFDKSHTPGRRMEDDVNLVVTPTIYRKSKRAQTEVDDETWVESDETNTQNAFDVGDARATELIVKPFTVHGEHSSAMTGNGDADVAFPTETARSLDTNGGYATNQGGNVVEELAQPLRTNPYNNSDPGMEAKMHVIQPGEAPPLRGFGHGWQGQHNDDVARAGIVRRLTVTECERLQAFPDGWTCLEVDYITHPDIEGPYLGFPDGTPYSTEECSCPDGPRYRALGNAVTTNAAWWVVNRLVNYEAIQDALGRHL